MTLGIALGAGAARGFAHIGVLRELESAGYRPDVVAGSSMGALVGAAYASGCLDRFEALARELRPHHMLGWVDFFFHGGVLQSGKVLRHLARAVEDLDCGALERRFGAVAADLETGVEVWLDEGSLHEAIAASIALPGLLPPVRVGGRWLVDGGIVNPVPTALCRALSARRIIAVELVADERVHYLPRAPDAALDPLDDDPEGEAETDTPAPPSPLRTMAQSLYLAQAVLTRHRLAGDPPTLVIRPRMGHIGLLEFHRAGEAIDEGRRATRAALRAHFDAAESADALEPVQRPRPPAAASDADAAP